MRSRTIKPGFFLNDKLGKCSPLARILFLGLWGAADWEGRLEYRPARLRAEILPYDTKADFESLIRELVEADRDDPMIEVYGGGRYLSIRNFTNHQNPHPNERKYPSKIPNPETFRNDNVMDGNVPDSSGIATKDNAGSSGPSGPSGPSFPAAKAAGETAEVNSVLDAYEKATTIRKDWSPQPKMPGNKDTKALIRLRASEDDFVAMLDRYVELVTALDWAEAKDIVFFLRRQTFDNCMSGEWGPRKKSAGKFQKAPDIAPISDPAIDMRKNKMYADLQEKANARKSAGADLF